jgi:hypothetical protein
MIQPTIICQACKAENRSVAQFCSECGKALPKPAKIFISYSHEDENFKKKFLKHLASLQRTKGTFVWEDRDIEAGTDWKTTIDSNLQTADIILLLISSDFIASSYCYSVEMKAAMSRHAKGEAKVVPIILRPTELEGTPFMQLQALPRDAKAVSKWPDPDEAWVNVIKEIKRLLP